MFLPVHVRFRFMSRFRFSRRLLSPMRLILFLAVGLTATAAFSQAPIPDLATPATINATPRPSNQPLTNLVFDSLTQEYHAHPGDAEAKFTFNVTNISDVAVHVLGIQASCSCTKAQMPRTPWIIAPHATEQFHAVMQLANKPVGENTKFLTVASTNGMRIVYVKAI